MIYYLAMQEHLFEESKCEILSLYDRTIMPTHVAYQNTGFLYFLNSLFIFSIVCQFLLLVLLDNQPTCVAPKFLLLLYQIERGFHRLLGQRKITFLDTIKCKEATVLDFCNKQKIFLIAFEFEGTFHLSELASWTSQLANEMGIFHRVFAEKPSPSQCILFRI